MPPTLHSPSHGRQGQRLGPKFQTLQDTFDARRLEIQASAPNNDPDLVVVFEIVGLVDDFIRAAERIPGLEWLVGMIDAKFEPDEDFYDLGNPEKSLNGKLFLLGSNRQALDEVVRLWTRYQADGRVNLGQGLNAWKQLFVHLKEVRFWGPQDRLDTDIRQHWQNRLDQNIQTIRFEIEAWCFASSVKNQAATDEIRNLVQSFQGRVFDELLLIDISYHGFLVEMPAEGIRQLLEGDRSALLMSDRVMFFRPQGQVIAPRDRDTAFQVPDTAIPPQLTSGEPVVALLDGLPMANHPRLRGRLRIDDPDGFAADYPSEMMAHGTAMASLVAWGELDGPQIALPNPIYVRPILKPDIGDDQGQRAERTPDDRLLLDIMHIAVRRMFEGAPGVPPVAPTVKVINLSVGDGYRTFGSDLSPWARLLDWLSYKYQVLFIVSSGNQTDSLVLNLPRDSLANLIQEQRSLAAMNALLSEDNHRRLIAPAESVNALTVGSCYIDSSNFPAVPARYTLFNDRGISPYSRIGPGFRRAIKPDILLPGGRLMYAERPISPPAETHVNGIWHTPRAPGQKVATPPTPSGDTIYTRGTSNAAALGTRGAAQTISVLEALRAGEGNLLPEQYDSVMVKALLAHGASSDGLADSILVARPDVDHWHAQRRLISRYVGYGLSDIDRALTCSEQRATMLGIGELRNDRALEFRIPIPEALNATLVKRKLTVTLAWLTPVNPRHSKYRVARLWADMPDDALNLTRVGSEARQVQLGTLQHEIFEGANAVPIVANQDLIIRVNCVADAGGRIDEAIKFALCASLEVAEGEALPIYEQIRNRISPRINIVAG